jgi:hypothetical protein
VVYKKFCEGTSHKFERMKIFLSVDHKIGLTKFQKFSIEWAQYLARFEVCEEAMKEKFEWCRKV